MKKGKIKLILILMLIMTMVQSSTSSTSSTSSIASESKQSVNSIKGITAYMERGPIEILNDSAFGPSGYNFTGIGTSNDPYLIENYNITASSGSLIHIENTTKYFNINNCYLNGLDSAYNMTRLVNVTHGTIENNYFCHGRSMGISLLHCKNNSIINNELYYIWYTGVGIYLFDSDNNTCSYNTIHEDVSVGIMLEFSHFNTFSSNLIYDVSAMGIAIAESNNNTYLYNTIRDHPLAGFFMQDSNNCTLSYNIIRDTHFAIKHQAYPSGGGYYNTFTHNTIYNSTVEGISLQDAINATITDNRIYNCGPNTLSGMFAGMSPYGISLSASHNNTINNNLIYDNFDYGLYFYFDSENNTATLNVFANNSYGIPSNNASAFDEGTNNIINSNYWDDYSGSGNYTLDSLNIPTKNNDTTPILNPTPTVNIDSPLNQTYYINTINITLSGFAIHFGYNIQGLDGDIMSFRPWNSNEERTLNSGTYTLEAMGRITENTLAFVSVTFTISAPPIITLNSPQNNTTHKSGTIIDVDINDTDLDTVLYNWDGTPNQTWSSNYVTSLPTGDSQHVLYVCANDSLGNWTAENFAFTTDDTGPTVSITTPIGGTTYGIDAVVLTYTVSEGTVTIYINGIPNTSAIPSGTTLHSLGNGVHNITITASDQAGNIGTETVIFTIDTAIDTTTTDLIPFPDFFTILMFCMILVIGFRKNKKI